MRPQLSTLFLFSLLFLSSQTLLTYSQIQAIAESKIKEFAVSSQTHKIVLGTETGDVYVYTQTNGLLLKKQKLMETSSEIVDVDITADGQWLMVVDAVNNVYIHRYIKNSGKFELHQKLELEGVQGLANGVMCTNHQSIAVGTGDGRVLILNFRKSLFVKEKQIQHYNQLIRQIKFDSDCSSMVVQTNNDASFYVLSTVELVKTLPFVKMSKKTKSNIAILDHVDFNHSKVKILTPEFVEQKELEIKFKINHISLTENFLIVLSENKITFYSRQNYSVVYEVQKNVLNFYLSGDEKFMVLQTGPQTLEVYMRQTFILAQNQQKVGLSPTVNTLAWEWIMIIVAGCFLFVVFLALIIYEWGCNGYRGEKVEEKREEGKNPETDKEIIKNGDEMMKGKESQSEAMIVENIA